jgi:hypothetical protein
MTVALKGSLTWESVLVRVSSRRMRRARSWGTVKGSAATSGMVEEKKEKEREDGAGLDVTRRNEIHGDLPVSGFG